MIERLVLSCFQVVKISFYLNIEYLCFGSNNIKNLTMEENDKKFKIP